MYYNQPEVIKYLLTSPKLKKNIVLNEELSLTAYFAGLMRDLDLTYLILEYGMKIPKEERESLKRMNFDKANKINYLFEKKDLEDTLNKELEIRTTKNKIKI